MLFDEWSSYLDSLPDKKSQDMEKRKLALLTRLGRSFRTYVLLSQQRFDASYTPSRENLATVAIGLGVMSKEAREILFSGFKDEIEAHPPRRRGTGFMLVNGANLIPVAVPTVKDIDRLHQAILDGVTR